MEQVRKSIEEIRKDLVEIRRMSKKEAWNVRERKRLCRRLDELETAVRVLRLRCGLS
jgi:hypothetical protein